jgi:OPA family glycerol-3-phosphate transporter-like MFS transporter
VWNCAHNVGAGSHRCCSCWGWPGLTTGTRRCICRHSARFCWRCLPSR